MQFSMTRARSPTAYTDFHGVVLKKSVEGTCCAARMKNAGPNARPCAARARAALTALALEGGEARGLVELRTHGVERAVSGREGAELALPAAGERAVGEPLETAQNWHSLRRERERESGEPLERR